MYHYIEDLVNTSGNQQTDNMVCCPTFFQLHDEKGKEAFNNFLKDHPNIQVVDEIQSQLSELVRLRFPKKEFSVDELNEAVKNHIGKIDQIAFGKWVYYPWLNKIVHILPEEEFIEVRTNRNQYKITPLEEEILANKKIGIIGLSVGKAIALTIALERVCGELVLADFDLIELSNLNRIQTGTQNFGLKKTVVVAREIAEIDPYLKVTCLHEGLKEQNADEFFLSGKKLDICIEVCDGLYTKIFAREKAKEFGIPVVMNSSDRGTTDVERYDLDRKLPILHGLIDHLDLSKVRAAKTNEEKVPYLLPMLGVESSSDRLKASMLEIQETITTWPQLASGVVIGGGICTDVCRRILLGQFTKSGRYFVDVEQLINDEKENNISSNQKDNEWKSDQTTTSDAQIDNIIETIDSLKPISNSPTIELTENELRVLVSAGIQAPSAGNSQPWKWLYRNRRLFLVYDESRGDSVLNYKNTVSMVTLGAAVENVVLKANEMGYEVLLKKFPLKGMPQVFASFSLLRESTFGTEKKDKYGLVNAIPYRITNRVKKERKQLNPDDVDYLQKIAGQIPGATLKMYTKPSVLEELREIIAEIDWIIMSNKSSHDQFMSEIRWNKSEVEETRDGLDINTLEISPTEKAGLLVSRNWEVVKHIKRWGLGKEFGNMSRNAIDTCSALGLITMTQDYPDAYLDGGRAVQKVWLAATQRELSFQPMSLSTFISERVADNNFSNFEEFRDKISFLFERMKTICEIGKGETDVFLFRLSYADEPRVKSLRRKIEDVLINDEGR